VGIGEELASLFDMINRKNLKAKSTPIERFNEEKRQEQLSVSLQDKPMGYQHVMRALEVARSLQLKRLYVHLLDMDIIIREGDLSQPERLKEIQAGLVAKWVVLRKLMSLGVITQDQSRDTMTQVKEEGFTALIETAQAIYERLNSPPSAAIELYGIYFEKYDRTVILIPVRWVYGLMQDQLRIVGAGDTTSTISAVQAILNN
jgi:hypothetical protein